MARRLLRHSMPTNRDAESSSLLQVRVLHFCLLQHRNVRLGLGSSDCDPPLIEHRQKHNAIFNDNVAQQSGVLRRSSLAILLEYPSASLVRVSNIFSDDWGVKFKVTFVPTPGLGLLRKTDKTSGDLSAAWEIFSFAASVWSARYIAWRLHFAPELVEKVWVVAGQMAEQGNQIDYRHVTKCLVEYEVAHPLFPESSR
jgi:hypothetical protein